jgi:hypothetical protein
MFSPCATHLGGARERILSAQNFTRPAASARHYYGNRFTSGSAPIYLLADFYSDGCVSIERMELTRAQFERVIRALRDEE